MPSRKPDQVAQAATCLRTTQPVEAFRANDESIAWAVDLVVTASAQRDARAPGCFANYLSALEDSLEGSIGR